MRIRAKGRVAGLAILGLAFVANNVNPAVGSAVAAGGTSGNPMGGILQSPAGPIDAKSDAQRHLRRFVEHVVDNSGHVRFDASVRIAVTHPDGQEGLIWVTPAAEINGIYKGRASAGERRSELVTFGIAQVRDWTFIGTDGRMYGNFTTRAALGNLDAAQAAPIVALLSADAVPVGW